MKKMYFTITGCVYRYGLAIFKPGMEVTLIKEPENKYDREAIRVEAEGLGTVGYVANSPKTVRGTSMSAGRLYDKISRKNQVIVEYILPDSVICSIGGDSLQYSIEDAGLEKLPEEETFLSTSTSADLDLYSQEDTAYLIPEKAEEDSGYIDVSEKDLNYPPQAAETEPDFSQPVRETETIYDAPVSENSYETPEQVPVPPSEIEEAETLDEEAPAPAASADDAENEGEKTLSPEEIASALTAALAGLAAGNEEDPDADYIYGNRTPSPSPEDIGNILSQNLSDLTAENISSVLNGSSGLSAEDFVNALTGGAGVSTPQDIDPDGSEDASAPSVSEPDSADTPEFIIPEQEERSSDIPGLNFNRTRFPEEMEGYVPPVRETLSTGYETAEETTEVFPENGTGSEDPSETNDYLSDREPESLPDIPGDVAAAEAASTEDPAEAEDDDSTLTDTESDATVDSVSKPYINHVAPEEEENADDITKPLVYDESELDENLAQLHLGDIDATYLSDSFLANLKKSLRESTY